MSLADKLIKNTFYYILFQLSGFIIPLLLTPFIISRIGEVQFGLYALILGFIGMFSLFDLSLSSSFIVFISRYHIKKDFVNLNNYFNTGLLFYIFFSLIIVMIGYFFTQPLLSLLNIPGELYETSVIIFYIGLIIFFVSSAFTIFSSILMSLQKMYVISGAGIFIGILNAGLTVLVLNLGYGLVGIMWILLITITLNNLLSVWYARSFLPELKFGTRFISKEPLREMSKFGTQMQVSKLASFASEKYDEFLLAYFSVLNNVTFFNIANRISRTGRLISFQIIPQVVPVASELQAREEKSKLNELFIDTTKYLTVISVPVFTFIFIFSDLIITTWMGKGYELSSYVLRILAVGQIMNMTFSAPGNTIITNIGLPKFQMREAFLYLGINLILSFLLIKYYGIIGAAIGSVFSTIIASTYLFFTSTKFFNENKIKLLSKNYFKPFVSGIVSGIVTFIIYTVSNKYLYEFSGRVSGILYLIILCGTFLFLYILLLVKLKFINEKDKFIIHKIFKKILSKRMLIKYNIIPANENEFY